MQQTTVAYITSFCYSSVPLSSDCCFMLGLFVGKWFQARTRTQESGRRARIEESQGQGNRAVNNASFVVRLFVQNSEVFRDGIKMKVARVTGSWSILFQYFSLKEETQNYVKLKERLQKRVEKHKVYNRFLEKTLEKAEDFHEIREIISRYDTLTATHTVMKYKILIFIL